VATAEGSVWQSNRPSGSEVTGHHSITHKKTAASKDVTLQLIAREVPEPETFTYKGHCVQWAERRWRVDDGDAGDAG
jgi:hypothetical protein